MKGLLLPAVLALVFLSSCRTTRIPATGMSRVKQYIFEHSDVPPSFDGFRIVFASDFHYKSRFKEKQLKGLVSTVNRLNADLFLMGGDYQEGCEYVKELAARLGEINTRFGTVGVMGNNDYERCYEEILMRMDEQGIKILEHQNDTIWIGDEFIIISGVKNPFDLKKNGVSPTLALSPEDFVILLTHTPDYTEDVDVSNADLALAGHTHGGQVTLFGLYAPVTASKYGQRLVKGRRVTSKGLPIIITTGLGTSRRNIRLFAPTEVVLIELHRR